MQLLLDLIGGFDFVYSVFTSELVSFQDIDSGQETVLRKNWLEDRRYFVTQKRGCLFAAFLVTTFHELREGKTASRALGYQQVLRYLDGALTLDQARAETVRATRRFARRQESWFRRDPRVRWLTAGADLRARAMSEIASRTVP